MKIIENRRIVFISLLLMSRTYKQYNAFNRYLHIQVEKLGFNHEVKWYNLSDLF